MKRHLGAGADDQAVIFIPVGHRDMRLDMRLLHLGHPVIRLKDALRLSKAFFYIANIDPDLRGPVDRWIRSAKLTYSASSCSTGAPGAIAWAGSMTSGYNS